MRLTPVNPKMAVLFLDGPLGLLEQPSGDVGLVLKDSLAVILRKESILWIHENGSLLLLLML
jgi:hypothetical protein